MNIRKERRAGGVIEELLASPALVFQKNETVAQTAVLEFFFDHE